MRVALALGLLGGAAPGALQAQSDNSPSTFSLPQTTPTPTPSPSVQGPLDERSGVRIAPRAITPEQVLPQAPPPTPGPATAPTRTPEVAPTAPATPTPTSTEPVTSPATASTQTPDLAQEAEETTPLVEAEPLGEEALPSAIPAQPDEGLEQPSDFLVAEGEWIDVAPSPSIDLGPPVSEPPPAEIDYGAPASAVAPWLWSLIAIALAALAWIAWRIWRTRPTPQLRLETDVISGARDQISATYGAKSQDRPQARAKTTSEREDTSSVARGEAIHPRSSPAPPSSQQPPPPTKTKANAKADATQASSNLALPLFMTALVTGATRSVRTFTVDFRVTIANRSDQAVRDLSVSAQLTSAQRGGLNEPSIGLAQSIAAIDRIGPQQSQTVSGSLQLAMADMRLIKQGPVSVFIPLLHISLGSEGQLSKTDSFVIGTPSETSQQRLHPIALDGSPGAVKGLRANPIKPFVGQEEPSPSQA